MKCGLIGETLVYSYSPMIHSKLGDYEYELKEIPKDDLEDFIKNGDWDGLNVTIPYKKSVIPFCESLSEEARAIGSVNTLVKDSEGKITGYNTDLFGFVSMANRSKIEVKEAKILILGSGGASNTARYALEKMDAGEIIIISRNGEDNYNNIEKHYDADIIVNTTPVGMFPDADNYPLNISGFKKLKGIIDIVYNPVRTGLILQAEKLGIPFIGGLHMLVAQAAQSSAIFTGIPVSEEKIDLIARFIRDRMENIILIGMPGCGKTTIAAMLGKKLEREVFDVDRLIKERTDMSIRSLMESFGEKGFRVLESRALCEIAQESGLIISTGGGCVVERENYDHLHRNGRIVWIKRDLNKLPKEGRPISETTDINVLYEERAPLYEAFADIVINNDGTVEEAADNIIEELDKKYK